MKAETTTPPDEPVKAIYSVTGWTLLFETNEGMCHPLRLHFPESATAKEAMQYASSYLAKNDWLRTVTDCYPTELPK